MDPRLYFDTTRLSEDQEAATRILRDAAITFARTLRDYVPPCEEQRHCILEVRKITHLAEAIIGLGGTP